MIYIAVVFIVLIIILIRKNLKLKKDFNHLKNKYKDIIDLDVYKDNLKNDINNLDSEIKQLKQNYAEKHSYFERLLKEVSLYEDTIEIFDYGLYKPYFNFETSEKYKSEIQNIRNIQKDCIKDGKAAVCREQWTVNGSKAEGTKQTKRYIKLMLRAFNGECDAMIADVRWNNITKMEERIEKSFEAINRMGETHATFITSVYKDMKLKELAEIR